jgi:hypothetical protein
MDTPKDYPNIFNFLQIRPIVDNDQTNNFKIDKLPHKDTIIYSESALGNGIISGLHDFIYIKPENFNASQSDAIAGMIEKLNDGFIKSGFNYILVGPGRWGSTDPWLGIPTKWAQISQARVIIESGLENFRIDPSQGTHFFQNLTSFRVGYFTINPFINDGFYDLDYLASRKAIFENEHIRHVRFEKPLKVQIDGKNRRGIILKPEASSNLPENEN